MASAPKSFEDLVKEAPPAPAAGTVTLVGSLAQAAEAGKFVLTLEDGNAVTLETAAVKAHAVLGTSVGRTIVRVDVDASKVPTATSGAAGLGFTVPSVDFATIATADRPITIPDIDHHFTVPQYDYTLAWWDNYGTPPWIDLMPQGTGVADMGPNTVQEGMPGFPGGSPIQTGGVTPFALATAQQAPASTLAALQGFGNAAFGTWVADFTGYWDVHHTGAVRDKIPPDDGATHPGGRFLD